MKRLIALLTLLAFSPFAFGLIWIQPSRFSGGDGGGGGPALVASLGTGAASGGDGFTTSAINSTGANLVAVAKYWYGASEPPLSDSKGNTYTATTIRSTAADTRWVRWYYVYGGTVGSGHTFTLGGTAHYASLVVLAFSGVSSSPLDQEASGEDTAWTSISSGSITPSQANTISLTALMHDSGTGTLTAPSTWTAGPVSSPSGGAHVGGAAAWKVLSSTSAINPAWSSDTSYLFGVVSHITIKY